MSVKYDGSGETPTNIYVKHDGSGEVPTDIYVKNDGSGEHVWPTESTTTHFSEHLTNDTFDETYNEGYDPLVEEHEGYSSVDGYIDSEKLYVDCDNNEFGGFETPAVFTLEKDLSIAFSSGAIYIKYYINSYVCDGNDPYVAIELGEDGSLKYTIECGSIQTGTEVIVEVPDTEFSEGITKMAFTVEAQTASSGADCTLNYLEIYQEESGGGGGE